MSITFAPAKRERVNMILSLAGPSGSGKTFSAMLLAEGLAGPDGKVAFLDTEARRGLHYAGRFKFDHADMAPPFKPQRFEEAIEAAERAGYSVLVIDSFSHEYEGEGGIIEWADEEAARGLKNAANWAKPKAAHKRMMTRALQARLHLIFCLRADEKIKIEKQFDERKGREVTVVVPVGFQPICEKRFPYEMTASFTFDHTAPGVPIPTKLQDQHRPFFPIGTPITAETGAMLREWAEGGAEPPRDPPAKPTRQPLPLLDEHGAAVPGRIGGASQWVDSYRALIAKAADKAAFARNNISLLRKIAWQFPDMAGADLEEAEAMIGGDESGEGSAEQ